jgi:hypothetical protein
VIALKSRDYAEVAPRSGQIGGLVKLVFCVIALVLGERIVLARRTCSATKKTVAAVMANAGHAPGDNADNALFTASGPGYAVGF